MTDDKKSNPANPGQGSSQSGLSGSGSATSGMGSSATPNRDKAREAPVVDAKPGDVKETFPAGGKPPESRPADAKPLGPIAALAANKPASASVGTTQVGQTDTSKTAEAGTTNTKTVTGAATGSGTAASLSPSASSAKPAGSSASAPSSSTGTVAKTSDAGKTSDVGKSKGPENKDGGKKSGFGTMAAASAAGAVIALAGAWGVQSMLGTNPTTSDLSERIIANETILAGLKKAPAVDIGPIEKRILALEAAAAQQTATNATIKSDLEKLSASRSASIADSRSSPSAQGQSSGQPSGQTSGQTSGQPNTDGTVAQLETRIAALEKTISAPKSSVRATDDPQAKRPAADETKTDEPARADAPQSAIGAGNATAAATVAKIPDEISRLPPEVTKLAARLQTLEGKVKPPADLGPVNDKLAELAKKFEPLEKQVDSNVTRKIAPIATAIAQSSTSIANNAKAIAAAGEKADISLARSSAAGTAIVVRTLLERVASGKPFGGLVSAIEAMGIKGDAVSALKATAEKGAPTHDVLAQTFKGLEDKILEPVAPTAGMPIMDRLKQGAFSLIKVRPVGETSSATPGGLFTRIGSALSSGKLIEARALYDKLPEKARKATADWAGLLQARIAADAAAQSILSDALKQLQQQKS